MLLVGAALFTAVVVVAGVLLDTTVATVDVGFAAEELDPLPDPLLDLSTTAETICPAELKMILTSAPSGPYEYCFCTWPPESCVVTPVNVILFW